MEAVAESKYQFMTGTNGGKDYLVIARNGDYGLGIKFYGAIPVSRIGKQYTGIVFKVRSAKLDEETVEDGVVVQLVKKPNSPESAFPVKWEKKDKTRASASVVIRLPGALVDVDGNMNRVADSLKDGTISKQFVEFFTSLYPEHQAVLTKEEIEQYILKELFQPMLAKLESYIKTQKKAAEALEEVAGQVMFEADYLKALYGKVQQEEETSASDESDAGEE